MNPSESESESELKSKLTPMAVITGAGSGIGRATALRFLSENWKVVLIGRKSEPLMSIEQAYPGKALALPTDLNDSAQVEKLCARLINDDSFGQNLKALVNNAGIYNRKNFADSDEQVWREMFEVNLLSPVRLTQGLLPVITKNRAVVINVSSTLGLRPVLGSTAYSAIKAAMVNWTQNLALELSKSGARANCICPGIIDTPLHGMSDQVRTDLGPLQPLGRVGTPDEIAHGIWSMAAPGSEWTTGSVLTIDGGISLV